MRITLEGRVAAVTGAGAGIGYAIAEAYDELGADLALVDIDSQKCANLRERFPQALVGEVDVRRVDQVEPFAGELRERFGRLDVLVNNVGHHLNTRKQLVDSTEEEWDAQYAVNLRHMFVVTRAVLPLMKSTSDGGSIINISSIEGFRGYPNNVIYGTFKSAVTGFTRSLALELAGDGIRVNCIAPETTRTEQVDPDRAIAPELRAQVDRTVPLGRFGRPEDHAGAAVYLATELSDWVTGVCLYVDGGTHTGNMWQRTPDGEWTNTPIITGSGWQRSRHGLRPSPT